MRLPAPSAGRFLGIGPNVSRGYAEKPTLPKSQETPFPLDLRAFRVLRLPWYALEGKGAAMRWHAAPWRLRGGGLGFGEPCGYAFAAGELGRASAKIIGEVPQVRDCTAKVFPGIPIKAGHTANGLAGYHLGAELLRGPEHVHTVPQVFGDRGKQRLLDQGIKLAVDVLDAVAERRGNIDCAVKGGIHERKEPRRALFD